MEQASGTQVNKGIGQTKAKGGSGTGVRKDDQHS